MKAPAPIHGVWCATLTPLDAHGAIDDIRFARHASRLLEQGVDGIAPFGTTGEGPSFSVTERMAALDALIAAGIAPGSIVPATGCAAISDTIVLTRHAVAAGCRGVLVLPPFFFKGIGARGLVASYAKLIDTVADPRLAMYLYHIPQVSGIAIDPDAVAQLVADHPGAIAGIKDSAGDLDHSLALAARFPQLSILVGHEPHIPRMRAAGGAGTICGIANLAPALVRRLYDGAEGDDVARIERFIDAVQRYPIFAAFKALRARIDNDAAWERLREPLVPLDEKQRRAWLADADASGALAPHGHAQVRR